MYISSSLSFHSAKQKLYLQSLNCDLGADAEDLKHILELVDGNYTEQWELTNQSLLGIFRGGP